MSNEVFNIPRHGAAGVAFLGVELKDAAILIASVFVGIAVGAKVGFGGYIGIPMFGYFLNKAYIDWKKSRLPGYVRTFLFINGLAGYSSAFRKSATIYVGDSVVINAGASTMLDTLQAKTSRIRHGD